MDKITTALVSAGILAMPYAVEAQVVTALPQATTPFTGQEACYIVQGGVSKQFPCVAANTSRPGTVTAVVCGTGLSGGTITGSGTCAVIPTVSLVVCGPGLSGGSITTTGTCALLGQEQIVTLSFSSINQVIASTGTLILAYRPANTGDTLVLDSIDTQCGGTASPSFTFSVLVNGTTVGNGGAISVGTTDVQTVFNANNTIASGGSWSYAITNVVGTVEPATLQFSYRAVP